MTDATDTGAVAPRRYFISEANLRALAADLLGAGTEVIAPVSVDACQSPSALASAERQRSAAARALSEAEPEAPPAAVRAAPLPQVPLLPSQSLASLSEAEEKPPEELFWCSLCCLLLACGGK